MPWCEPCERFYNPNSVNSDGSCATCGQQLGETAQEVASSVPWHFWVLIGALALYLGWRVFQGVSWALF